MNKVDLTISAAAGQPGSFRLIFTLGVAGMFAGLALASVYQITKPIIDANNARQLKLAVFKVVPGSARLQKFVLRNGKLVAVGDNDETTEPSIHLAYDQAGQFRGYAIAGSGPGFQDTIRLMYGYDHSARRITGLHILESRETPGLGDKIFKDPAFAGNFAALSVEPQIVAVKGGRSADNEVDAITGATISSKAVVKIINTANEKWLAVLPPPGREPAGQQRTSDTADRNGEAAAKDQ